MSEAFKGPTRSTARAEVRDLALSTGKFDPDVWHVLDQRDNALIADEIINGASSSKFVYSFPVRGSSEPVSGISVVGARHLAAHYGGIKHRLVASVRKTGALFQFTSYPSAESQMSMSASVLRELAGEPDFFQALVEVTDVKAGNSIQMERQELRWEVDKKGNEYERPHYATIAQAKAYRNGVLALIPQDVQLEWIKLQLKLGKNETIIGSVIDEKRAGVLRFAAAKGIAVDRQRIDGLMLDQIAGLSDAARVGSIDGFRASAEALGILTPSGAGSDSPVIAFSGKASAATKPVHQVDPRPVDQKPAAQPATQPTQVAAAQGASQGHPAREEPSSATPTATAPAPEFTAYLFDQHGEPVMIADGTRPVEYENPTVFARALIALWEKAGPMRGAIADHNADGIVDARCYREAAAILDALDQAREEDAAAEPLLVPVPTTPKGSPHVPNYKTALRARLSSVTAEQVMDFCAENQANILSLPATGRMQCIELIRGRCAALGVQPPKMSQAEPTQTNQRSVGDAPLEDADRKRADAIRDDIERCATPTDLQIYGDGVALKTVMARFERERPDLAEELKTFANEHMAQLRSQA